MMGGYFEDRSIWEKQGTKIELDLSVLKGDPLKASPNTPTQRYHPRTPQYWKIAACPEAHIQGFHSRKTVMFCDRKIETKLLVSLL